MSRTITLSAFLLASCLWGCTKTVGLTLALSHDVASCGAASAWDVPLNYAGTAAVHVVDRSRALVAGEDVLGATCVPFAPSGNRTLEDLPALLAQGVPIADLPSGQQVAVEIRVVRGQLTNCARHTTSKAELFGSSSWIGFREGVPIKVRLRCPTPALAHWTFDGVGNQEPDVSGNGNQGQLVGGATRVQGIRGSGLALDGIDDAMYLMTGTGNLGVPLSDLTLAAWIRTDNPVAPRHVLSEMTMDQTGYRLTVTPGGSLEVYVRDLDDMQPSTVYSSSSSYADRGWHHVAVVADRNGQLLFYRDGEPDGGGDISSSTGFLDGFALFAIGTDGISLAGGYFSGYIDDVQVHPRVLSPGEITALASGN